MLQKKVMHITKIIKVNENIALIVTKQKEKIDNNSDQLININVSDNQNSLQPT